MFKDISKITKFFLVIFTFLIVVSQVFASEKCFLNSHEIACSELNKPEKFFFGFLGLTIGLLVFCFIIFVSSLIFWVMMLVHLVKNDVKDKMIWLILMIFTGIIGAIIYYFVVKREFNKKPKI